MNEENPSELDAYFAELEAQEKAEAAQEAEQALDSDEVDERDFFATENEQPTEVAGKPLQRPDQASFELQRQLAMEQGRRMQMEQIMAGVPQYTEEQPSGPIIPQAVYNEDLALDEVELDAYQGVLPVIQKLAKQMVNDVYQREIMPLKERLIQDDARWQALHQQSQQERAQSFHRQLHREIPDLANISATPEFRAYIERAAPQSGGAYTIKDTLKSAITYGNINAIREIVDGFKPTPKPGMQNVAPGRAQSGNPPITTERRSNMLAHSGLEKAERDVMTGLITPAKYAKIVELYQKAEFEGRVDYNK